MCLIWPDLKFLGADPFNQRLKSPEVLLHTGMERGIITLPSFPNSDSPAIEKVQRALDVWRAELGLTSFKRVSSRVVYAKEFASLKMMGEALASLKLVRLPSSKVFDQPVDSDMNTVDVNFRFETKELFTFVRVHTESVELKLEPNADFPELPKQSRERFRLIVDVDRGVLGTIKASTFRFDEWVKGFHHVVRRDIDKVLLEGERP